MLVLWKCKKNHLGCLLKHIGWAQSNTLDREVEVDGKKLKKTEYWNWKENEKMTKIDKGIQKKKHIATRWFEHKVIHEIELWGGR